MTDFFSPDYKTARDRFQSSVLANGGQIESILLNAKGPAGEDLTVDIGWFGPASPRRAFLHISGLHGVEGFAGSAIQLQWLETGIRDLPADCAVAIVHAMNPYGMAWLRRVNENNVDLNHNFLPADEAWSGAPENFAALNPLLNPASPPSLDLFPLRATLASWRYGKSELRRILSGGQYDFPQSLFFGGKQYEQVNRRFQLYISSRLAWADRLVAVDVHTGAGDFPAGMEYSDESEYSDDTATKPRGTLGALLHRMFPAARVRFESQKFGSCSELAALSALRAENRQHHFADPGPHTPAKAKMLAAFCPADPAWRARVLASGAELIRQGLDLAFRSEL